MSSAETIPTITIACLALVVSPAEIPTMRAMASGIAPFCEDFRFFVATNVTPEEDFPKGFFVHDLSAIGANSIPPDEWTDAVNNTSAATDGGGSTEPNFFQKWAMAILHAYESVYAQPDVDEELDTTATLLEQQEKIFQTSSHRGRRDGGESETSSHRGQRDGGESETSFHRGRRDGGESQTSFHRGQRDGGESETSSHRGRRDGGESETNPRVHLAEINHQRAVRKLLSAAGSSSSRGGPSRPPPAWYCMIESDVYFVPENFRRFILLKNHDPFREALFLAHMWLFSDVVAGFSKEHSYGSCFSRLGFVRFAKLLGRIRDEIVLGQLGIQGREKLGTGGQPVLTEAGSATATPEEQAAQQGRQHASHGAPVSPFLPNSAAYREELLSRPLPQSRNSLFGARAGANSSYSEFGPKYHREKSSHSYECLPFLPHVWSEANRGLLNCLHEAGMPGPADPDESVDVAGRYFWGQGFEEVFSLAPPSTLEQLRDFSLLGRWRPSPDVFRGMWLGRVLRNRLCAAAAVDVDKATNAAYASYPISFHGHRGRGVVSGARFVGGRWGGKRRKLSMECVHALVRGALGGSFGARGNNDFHHEVLEAVLAEDQEERGAGTADACVGEDVPADVQAGYRPKIWDWREEQVWDGG